MLLFFFFQAEDGIRDHCVTGVQTCALPISAGIENINIDHVGKRKVPALKGLVRQPGNEIDIDIFNSGGTKAGDVVDHSSRSEERRVGKECRSRWSTYH